MVGWNSDAISIRTVKGTEINVSGGKVESSDHPDAGSGSVVNTWH
jgi:hypothetical protein